MPALLKHFSVEAPPPPGRSFQALGPVGLQSLELSREVPAGDKARYMGYVGILEKKMETTIVYWGYIGIMENKMETTSFFNLGHVGC